MCLPCLCFFAVLSTKLQRWKWKIANFLALNPSFALISSKIVQKYLSFGDHKVSHRVKAHVPYLCVSQAPTGIWKKNILNPWLHVSLHHLQLDYTGACRCRSACKSQAEERLLHAALMGRCGGCDWQHVEIRVSTALRQQKGVRQMQEQETRRKINGLSAFCTVRIQRMPCTTPATTGCVQLEKWGCVLHHWHLHTCHLWGTSPHASHHASSHSW